MGEMRSAYNILENLKEVDYLGDLVLYERIMWIYVANDRVR
jgi:hypothetical protein